MSLRIDLELRGYYCNHWPIIEIYHEDKLIVSRQVEDKSLIQLDIECGERSQLRMRQIGKRFGEQDVWDTDVATGQDCWIEIQDIRFDDVTMGQRLIDDLTFVNEWSPIQRQHNDPQFIDQWSRFACNGRMNFNGYIDIDFTMPIYNWLILTKYKTNRSSQTSYFSSYTDNWHYEEDLEILKEIKELMKFE